MKAEARIIIINRYRVSHALCVVPAVDVAWLCSGETICMGARARVIFD